MAKIEKTNAARILDRLKIAYEMVEYTVDENNLAADHVAEELGEPIEQVFKTLVLRGDRNGLFVCVIAGDREVDLKKAEMIHMKELLPATGYIRGGCTSIGMKKPYPVFLSEEALGFPFIYVSAGKRGMQLKLAPADLVKATGATPADITTPAQEEQEA